MYKRQQFHHVLGGLAHGDVDVGHELGIGGPRALAAGGAQFGRARLYRDRFDLRHARGGRAGARRIGKDVAMDHAQFADDRQVVGMRGRVLGRKAGYEVCPECDVRPGGAQAFGQRQRIGAIVAALHAFEDEVDAYPSITTIRRGPQEDGPLVVDACHDFGPSTTQEVVELNQDKNVGTKNEPTYSSARLSTWFDGAGGWPTASPERLVLIADLETRFPNLEDERTGTKVGIGVATGADKIFIVDGDPPGVEAERLLPLAMVRNIQDGSVNWGGKKLVNPWSQEGLVSTEDWPGMTAYLEPHKIALSDRHTAKSGKWHKTIDRVIEGLVDRPKLYLPDFKESIFPVLDEGGTYPHHNLYWVISDSWDLRVLGGLLLSDISNMFIEAYSVRMRGGYLRFQAQYLRRICLPNISDVSSEAASSLAEAFESRDRKAATQAALPLYGLKVLPA